MNKFLVLYQVLQQGQQVADPAFWKNKQAAINGITALIMSLAALGKVFGYDFGVTEAVALMFASAIVPIANIVLIYATSKKVGLRPKPNDNGSEDTSGV